MKRRILYAVAALVGAILAGPTLAHNHAGSKVTGQFLVADAASDQIQVKAVLLNNRRRGDLMDVEIRVEFDGVPQGDNYQFFMYDAGMERDGLAPAPVPNASHRWAIESSGHIEFTFYLDGFSKGEWIQLRLRSTDGSIQKGIRFAPFK